MNKRILVLLAGFAAGNVLGEMPNIPSEFGTTNQCYFVTEDEMVYAFYQVGENTFTVPENIGGPATVLLVGGGGAGGPVGLPCGGGGGEVVLADNVLLMKGATFAVTVGEGSGLAYWDQHDIVPRGGASTLTANGGDFSLTANGGVAGYRNAGSSGNGNAGGESATYAKGGGGGANGAGGNGNAHSANDGGVGGAGVYCSICGAEVVYGAGGGGGQMWPWIKEGAYWGWGGANDGYGNAARVQQYPADARQVTSATQGRDGAGGGGGAGTWSTDSSYMGDTNGQRGGNGCVIIRFKVGEPVEKPVIASVIAEKITTNGVTIAVSGSELNDGEITVTIKKDESVVQTKKSDDWGAFLFDGLAANTEYMVSVAAANIGGEANVICSFKTEDYPWSGTTNTCYKLGKKEWVHIYREPGSYTFTAPMTVAGSVRILVVGGGGAGATLYGGGGGGGQVSYYENISFENGCDYTITVGNGGIPAQNAGGNGEASSVVGEGLNYSALGGGGGGGGYSSRNGCDGANGGGAGGQGSNSSGGKPTVDGGFAGGASVKDGNQISCGGGGGAGGPGGDGTLPEGKNRGGDGGLAVSNSIVGVSIGYGYGGGGTVQYPGATSYGHGGAGDGYGDSPHSGSTSAQPGQAGTGGGGGGGGAAGGCGCVIIRYTEASRGITLLYR